MTEISTIHSIVGGVQFANEAVRHRLHIDADLGFLALDAANTEGEVTVLGFSGSAAQNHITTSEITHSITELAQVPLRDQTIDKQGKGVGMRLYNTPHAFAGLADAPTHIGAYTVTLRVGPGRILDTRKASDATMHGKLQRISRHAGRMMLSVTEDLSVLTNTIHESYGVHDAVLISQPPLARLREILCRTRPPIPSEFLIIRNRWLDIRRVGAQDISR
jgi:hypothetical protein